MKKSLKLLYRRLLIRYNYLNEAVVFWKKLNKHNASRGTDKNIQKMQYTILRENHVIEKGMSLRNPRKGFGQAKVSALLKRLDTYLSKYADSDKDFVIDPLSTIKRYIDYTVSMDVDITIITEAYKILLSKYNISSIEPKGGILEVQSDAITHKAIGNFKELLYSRHSVRYFSNSPVSKELIEKALELAQRTPSACNRQAWKTHIYFDDNSHNLLKWQGGCRGFEEEIHCSIVVTSNLNGFLYYEPHQAYVDGGMYAMNLINALHYLGLATIPLSCGFLNDKLKKLSNFGISGNEAPIVIIGVGIQLDKYNVAVSLRKEVSTTNTYY